MSDRRRHRVHATLLAGLLLLGGGTAFEITWSWQLEGAADLKASVGAGSAATQVQAEYPRSDFPSYVVTLTKAAR